MSLIMIYLFFIFVVVILVLLALLLSEKMEMDSESLSSFECGFISFEGSRLTFSLQFFLIGIIFLIFDVEIALILPIPVIFNLMKWITLMSVFLFFVLVILGGLYYEWNYGILDWAY